MFGFPGGFLPNAMPHNNNCMSENNTTTTWPTFALMSAFGHCHNLLNDRHGRQTDLILAGSMWPEVGICDVALIASFIEGALAPW